MAWSDDEYIVAFDAEAGDIESLATDAEKILWFNEALGRLTKRRPRYDDLTWNFGDRAIDLPADFVTLDKWTFDTESCVEPWRVWGLDLVIDDPEGASNDGGMRLYYYAEWTPMTTGTTATELNASQDHACLSYALHRFIKKIVSNRAFYKRYATLVGQNSVTMADLEQMSDRYLQDFLDAREDLEPDPPAFFFSD